MPKHDKNDSFKGLILGHKVLQKQFFPSQISGLISSIFEPEIELEEGSIPTYH